MKTLLIFLSLFCLVLGQYLASEVADNYVERVNDIFGSTPNNQTFSPFWNHNWNFSSQTPVTTVSTTPTTTTVTTTSSSTVQVLGDAFKEAYSQVIRLFTSFLQRSLSVSENIPDKEALINSIKGFDYGKSANITVTSDQSDAGRAELTNYIINCINDGSMDPREAIHKLMK